MFSNVVNKFLYVSEICTKPNLPECVVKRYCTSSQIVKSQADVQNVRKKEEKAVKFALLGAPNVGKSTIVNRLINRSICATSPKVHTTQKMFNAVYSLGDIQLVLVDTPGVVTLQEKKKYKLKESLKNDPISSANKADLIGVIQDLENRWTRDKLDKNILELLNNLQFSIPTILILNKVDKIKDKKILLSIIDRLTNNSDWPHFSDVFIVSALNGDGIDDLRCYLIDSATPQQWQYEKNTYTDQPVETIITEIVRAKLLEHLPRELPYSLETKMEYFEIRPDESIICCVNVVCKTVRLCQVVIGKGGSRINIIARHCEDEIQHAFRTPVNLKIGVIASN